MDHLLAKVKRQRKKPYKKLLSDTTLYSTIDLDTVSLVDYDPDHNLDEDAWFKIEQFNNKDFFIDEIKNDFDAKDYNELEKKDFENISCLLSIQGKDVYFQKVTPSSFIKRKLIHFGEAASLEQNSNRIIIKVTPDAVFLRNKNMLLFKDIASVSSIFKGIDQLYKEATDIEVKQFLNYDFIKVVGTYNYSSVSKPNRKRLALVLDTLEKMTGAQRLGLVKYIKEYCRDNVKITKDGKQFELSTDIQLKLVLYGIEERFYTTQHSQEKRLANSVEKIL